MFGVPETASDFVWEGELGDEAQALAAVQPTGQFDVLGQPFLFPTRDDYVKAFVRCGLLSSDGDLTMSAECVAMAQAHWHATGHNACVFASHMSGVRSEIGWETIVLAPRGSARRDAEALAAVVHPRLVDPAADVISVVVPHGDELLYVARLLARLGELPGWSLEDLGTEHDPEHGELVLIGLRNEVEFDYLAEVLGFGPCGVYANTRKAPFTELAIRAKPPSKRRSDKRAFMAQVDIPHLAKDEVGLWWAQTKANRSARISPEQDTRGKAKVSVAIPSDLWEQR